MTTAQRYSTLRFRACESCRKLKKKCDSDADTCAQCKKYRRTCVRGFVYQDYNEVVRDRIPQDQRIALLKARKPIHFSADSKQGHRDRLSSSEMAISQISSSRMNTMQFVSKWVDLLCSSPQTNLYFTLQPMIPGRQSPTVENLCVAGYLLYYGREANDRGARMQAYAIYGRELQLHKKRLNSPDIVMEDYICNLFSLALFELVGTTSSSSFDQHIIAAEKLLAISGPEACRTGSLHRLFRMLRTLLLSPAILARKAPIFAQEDWMTIPFLTYPRTSVDRIVDVLLMTPSLLQRVEESATYSDSTGLAAVEDDANDLLKRLEDIQRDIDIIMPIATPSQHDTPNQKSHQEDNQHRPDRSQLYVMYHATMLMHGAAKLMVYSVFKQISEISSDPDSDSTQSHIYTEKLVQLSEQVLQHASTVEYLPIWIAMLLPLFVVCETTPDPTQKKSVIRLLISCAKKKGVGRFIAEKYVEILKMKEAYSGNLIGLSVGNDS